MSYAKFSPDELGPGGAALLKTLSFFRLAKVEWSEPVGKGKKAEITVNNLTIINFMLKLIGPTHESTLTMYILLVQVRYLFLSSFNFLQFLGFGDNYCFQY